MTAVLNEWGHAWAGYFGTAVAQNTVFLGLVLLLLHALRNKSARIRYAVGMVGLFKLLLPPFVPTGVLASSPAESILPPLLVLDGVFAPVAAQPGALAGTSVGLNIYGSLFLSWLVFAAAYVGAALVATARLRFSLRGAEELPQQGGPYRYARRRAKLLRSEAVVMPLTLGIFSNRIYVPAAWDRWSERCRETVLQHETAHIHRKDGLFQGLQILTLALYFFHPMVWFLNRRLNEYREMACDDASVTGERQSRIEYSRNLVEIAETIARDSGLCETASALLRRKKEITNRVEYQMKEEVMRSVSKLNGFILAAALGMFAVAFSWYPGDAALDNAAAGAVLSESQSSASSRCVRVQIEGDKDVTVDAASVSINNFPNALSTATNKWGSDFCVDLKCDNNTPMKSLVTVHDALKNLKVLRVRYQSDLGKALPLILPTAELEDMAIKMDKKDVLSFLITESGRVESDGKNIPMGQIDNLVETRLSENDHLIVSIKFEEDAKYGDFVRVLDQAKNGGAPRIIIGRVTK